MAPYEAYKVEYERTAGDFRDITGYVEHVEFTHAGRAVGSDTSEPGTGTLTLNNADHRWTPGNVTSPEYPYWRQRKRIRITETIGYRSFPSPMMWTQAPEITDWVESGDQTITVPLVDRLGWLDTARTLRGTLTEHILYQGGSALKAYYPLMDPGPAVSPVGVSQANATPVTFNGAPPISYRQGIAVPADPDQLPAQFTAVDNSHATYLQATLSPAITVDSTQAITLVAWVNLDATSVDDVGKGIVYLTDGSLAVQVMQNFNSPPTTNGEWRAWSVDLGVSILGGPAAKQQWQLVAARFQLTTAANAQELWVGGSVYQGAASSPPASLSLTTLRMGYWARGTIAHAQVYVDQPTGWGRTQFLNQLDVGFNGHDRERVDDRVRRIGHYAGLTDTDMQLDVCSALMQAARLAGQRPGALMRSAVDTERGRLLSNGAGQVVVHSRQRTYNV